MTCTENLSIIIWKGYFQIEMLWNVKTINCQHRLKIYNFYCCVPFYFLYFSILKNSICIIFENYNKNSFITCQGYSTVIHFKNIENLILQIYYTGFFLEMEHLNSMLSYCYMFFLSKIYWLTRNLEKKTINRYRFSIQPYRHLGIALQ